MYARLVTSSAAIADIHSLYPWVSIDLHAYFLQFTHDSLGGGEFFFTFNSAS